MLYKIHKLDYLARLTDQAVCQKAISHIFNCQLSIKMKNKKYHTVGTDTNPIEKL
jgi:hypothetical protein